MQHIQGRIINDEIIKKRYKVTVEELRGTTSDIAGTLNM